MDDTLRPRKRPRQARAQATVTAILDAAAHILCSEGYAALSTNHIARRAGVSVGSLYQYFPNKEAIMMGLMERFGEQQMRLFDGVFEQAADAPVPEAARIILGAILNARMHQPELQRAFLQELPDLGQHAMLQQGLDLIAALIAQHLKRRAPTLRLLHDDPHLTAHLLVYACHGVIEDSILRPDDPHARSPAELAEPMAMLVERVLGR